MLKLRYNAETGKIGSAYPEDVNVPEPYILITEAENSAIKDRSKYYVINGELTDITDTDKEKELSAKETAVKLTEQLYQLKASVAYSGIILNNQYVFETNELSILMTVSKAMELATNPSTTIVEHWKCYDLNGTPKFLTFTREQFLTIKDFANDMIGNKCFGVENKYTLKLQSATVKQLNSASWLSSFTKNAVKEMNAIDKNLNIDDIVVE